MVEQPQVTVEIEDSKQISVDSILFALFGVPIEELVKEIRDNSTAILK